MECVSDSHVEETRGQDSCGSGRRPGLWGVLLLVVVRVEKDDGDGGGGADGATGLTPLVLLVVGPDGGRGGRLTMVGPMLPLPVAPLL